MRTNTHTRLYTNIYTYTHTLANVRAIEMENGLIPVPASSGFPDDGLRGARLNELLELHAEKNMSSWNISVTTPLEGSSDDGISNILHQPSSIHLIPAGTALVHRKITREII